MSTPSASTTAVAPTTIERVDRGAVDEVLVRLADPQPDLPKALTAFQGRLFRSSSDDPTSTAAAAVATRPATASSRPPSIKPTSATSKPKTAATSSKSLSASSKTVTTAASKPLTAASSIDAAETLVSTTTPSTTTEGESLRHDILASYLFHGVCHGYSHGLVDSDVIFEFVNVLLVTHRRFIAAVLASPTTTPNSTCTTIFKRELLSGISHRPSLKPIDYETMASYFSAHYARNVRLFRAVFTRAWAVKRVDDVIVDVDVPSEGNLPALARHKEDDPYVVKTTIPVAHSKEPAVVRPVEKANWQSVKTFLDEELLRVEMQLRAQIDAVGGK